MTLEEMDRELREYCYSMESCDNCTISSECRNCGGNFYFHENECEKAHDVLYGSKRSNNESKLSNTVDHPKHYNRKGGMECIDEMILVFGTQAVKYFCLCNAWKYRYRSGDKNGEEDISKSDWYLAKYKELCNEEMDY